MCCKYNDCLNKDKFDCVGCKHNEDLCSENKMWDGYASRAKHSNANVINYREEVDKMANKAKLELTKEEIGVIIDGLDILDDMESVALSELQVDADELRQKLSKIFYKLKWK